MTISREHLAAVVIAAALLLAGTRPSASRAQNLAKPCDSCSVVLESLQDANHLGNGMPRSELEKSFRLESGLNFRDHSRYVYRKCPYIKIDVEFSPDPKVNRAMSPADLIKSVSKPYLELEIKD